MGLNSPELEQFTQSLGEKKFHGRQIYNWIYQKRAHDFNDMTNISKKLREMLINSAEINLPVIDAEYRSANDSSVKFRLRLKDDNHIESVLMHEPGRTTFCVSTQIGCQLGCVFCATGYLRYKRNLTAGEIVGQVIVSSGFKDSRISNIVFMGMGEPLMNYENVKKAILLLSDGDGLAISSRKITLSTAGVVPGIDRLSGDRLPCKLAVSLNAPDDALRSRLMPINRKYPLKELLPALHRYEKTTRHRVTFEYVLLGGINDSIEHAVKLKKLLGGFTAKLNLIAYNTIDFPGNSGHKKPLGEFKTPDKVTIEAFMAEVERPGLTVMLRKSQGGDIAAACGQLCLHDAQ